MNVQDEQLLFERCTERTISFSSTDRLNSACSPHWTPKAVIIDGGNRKGKALIQLDNPKGLSVDDNQTVLVADSVNHRIVEREHGAKTSRVMIDQETHTLIVCE